MTNILTITFPTNGTHDISSLATYLSETVLIDPLGIVYTWASSRSNQDRPATITLEPVWFEISMTESDADDFARWFNYTLAELEEKFNGLWSSC